MTNKNTDDLAMQEIYNIFKEMGYVDDNNRLTVDFFILLSKPYASNLVGQFREKAIAGQMVEISEIKLAYEKETGCSLDNNHGQIYRVLKRHDWRKIMPRSKHQNKASDEAIDASKKLKVPSKMKWKILQVERFD